jgi:AbrB family looped-hinge helix DNA binding protein
MTMVRVGPNHEVVIPKSVRAKLGVQPGDYIEFAFQHDQAVIKPKKAGDDFPVTDEPIGPKTRAHIRQAMKEVEAGHVSGPYKTAEEVQRHLDALKR